MLLDRLIVGSYNTLEILKNLINLKYLYFN
jgi:hypothetical protein